MLRTKLELLAIGLVVLAGLLGLNAWRSSRKQQAQLQATLDEQQSIISDTDEREAERRQSLNTALAEIVRLKKQTHTAQQVVAELPRYIPLPQPIRLERAAPKHEHVGSFGESTTSAGVAVSTVGTSNANGGAAADSLSSFSLADASGTNENIAPRAAEVAEIPSADLKPIFDFAQDCRVCQMQLQSAQRDAIDNSIKLIAFAKQRDLATKTAKGRSVLSNLKHNFAWFAAGTALGLAASRR